MNASEREREVQELFLLLREIRTLDPEMYAEMVADMRRQVAENEKK